jgi:hypothetical protein
MTPETLSYPTAVVLSLSSGRMLCAFSEMHACAEFLAGTPILTHQFAHRPFIQELREAIFRQHPALREFDADAVTRDTWMVIRDAAVTRFGAELPLQPMGEPEHYEDAFTQPLAGKKVIVVQA